MRPKTPAPILILLLGIAAARGDEAVKLPAATEAVWRATEVPGFVVYGDVPDRALFDVADRLARLRAVLARTAAGLETGSERPIPVYVFRSTADFKPYAPGGTKPLGGYFATAFGYRAIAIDHASRGGSEAVYHELVHHIVRRNFGEVPLWFNEGIATLYETFRCGETTATVGWVPRARLALLDVTKLMPVKQLAAVTDRDPEYNESERASVFYLESWLLVHDLLYGHPGRGAQLADYLKRIHEGRSQDEALESAFTGGSASLDEELAEYLKNAFFPLTDISFSTLKVAAPTATRELSRTEALIALGMLALVGHPRDPADARAHFEAALGVQPGQVAARAGLGATAVVQKRYDEALPNIEAALAGGVDDPALLVLGARALVDTDNAGQEKRGPPAPTLQKARAWLERAIKADPWSDEALKLYGLTFMRVDDDPAGGIAAFERADKIDPLDDGSLYDLLELYVRKRDRAAAESLFAKRIESRTRPEIVGSAREALLRLDYNDARDATKAGDYEKAIELVRRVRDKTTDDALRGRMADLAGRLEAAAASKTKPPAAAPKPSPKP